MKLAVASDHRGYEAKRRLLPVLRTMGHEVQDFGCEGTGAVDYPDYACTAARAVAEGRADIGILMDGSGIGMSIAANKIRGVRAALVHEQVTARRAREHNHCNVLCLGTDLLGEEQIRQIVEIFLSTEFGNGRHIRRVGKLCKIEQEELERAMAAGGAGANDYPVGASEDVKSEIRSTKSETNSNEEMKKEMKK